jgi:hypothetical protein
MKKGDGKKIIGLLVLIAIAVGAVIWQATRPEPKLPPFETMPPPGAASQPNAGRTIGPVPSDDAEGTPSQPKEKASNSKEESSQPNEKTPEKANR